MSRGMRELLVGVLLTLVACAAVLWQMDQAGALRPADARAAEGQQVSVPRLICPLH